MPVVAMRTERYKLAQQEERQYTVTILEQAHRQVVRSVLLQQDHTP